MLVKRPYLQPLDPVKLLGQAKSNAPNVSTVMWPGSYLVKLVGLAVVKRPYLLAIRPTVNRCQCQARRGRETAVTLRSGFLCFNFS